MVEPPVTPVAATIGITISSILRSSSSSAGSVGSSDSLGSSESSGSSSSSELSSSSESSGSSIGISFWVLDNSLLQISQ